MDFMLVKRDKEEEENVGRRIKKSILLFKTGTIFMTHHGQITTKNTNIAMKRSEKSGSGRIDCMRIGKPKRFLVIETVTMRTITVHK
jgi:hypothetical protein